MPRVGLGFIDKGIDPARLPTPSRPYGALPVLGVSRAGAASLAEAARVGRVAADFMPDTTILRRLLIASARPGSGLGCPPRSAQEKCQTAQPAIFLARLTAADYLRVAMGESDRVGQAAHRLGDTPLTDDMLPAALQQWREAAFVWAWDFRLAEKLRNLTFVNKEGNLQ